MLSPGRAETSPSGLSAVTQGPWFTEQEAGGCQPLLQTHRLLRLGALAATVVETGQGPVAGPSCPSSPLPPLFQLTMPSPMPEYLNVHYICESASRLLFLSMHWARSIPAFQALG